MGYRLGQVCEHGSLARSCELCELQAEVKRLEAEVERDHSLCIAENEALAAERDRLTAGIRALADALDRHRWAFDQGHDNEPELGDRLVRAVDDLVDLLDDREGGQ